MGTYQNDELLQQIVDELGQLRKLLDERLPQPVQAEPPAVGPRQVVVTGEGSGEGPSSVTSYKTPPAKKAAAKPH
jgi:hypothetical protein